MIAARRVLLSDFLHSTALLPLIPPSPFFHTGRRGTLGVLMPETGDSTQGLPKKPAPVSISPAPFSHKGRRGTLGVLMPETGDSTQGLVREPARVRKGETGRALTRT